MGKVMLCVGETAAVPYYMEQICMSIYSVEELCFFFREHTYLLDQALVNRKLVEWLDRECHLPELARELYSAVNKSVSVQSFAGMILVYTGFYDTKEIAGIERIIQAGGKRSTYEKQTARADYFLEKKRYSLAITEYEGMLTRLQDQDPLLRGRICHNYALCQAGLFYFRKAAEYFHKAFQLCGAPESREQYLIAMRYQLGEKEYIAYLSEHPEFYEASLEAEKKLVSAGEAWKEYQESDEYDMQDRNRLKENYRELVPG